MKTLLSAAIGTMLALSAMEAGAQNQSAERKVELEIEQQSLADALNDWAKQTGLQLVSPSSEMLNTKLAPRVKGTYSPQAALEELLKGTTLTYEWVSERAVAIKEKSKVVPAALKSSGVFQEQTIAPIAHFADETDGERRLAAVDQSAFGGDAPAGQDSAANTAHREELEQIIVTGTRLKTTLGDRPASVITMDEADFRQLGLTTVAQVFSYLPQQSFAVGEQNNFGGARMVRLRGLGLGTTLVLIDGQRTVTSALQSAGNVFDLNDIPLPAVDRIEVLTNSASAVYGADAVGGVVNVILKKNIERPALDLYVGSADGGADERRASLAFGTETDRIRASAVLDVFDRKFLRGDERTLYANQDFTRYGSSDLRSSFSNPGTVYSLSGANLPGVGAPSAAVPRGQGDTPTQGDFAATAGMTNLESLNRFSSVIPEAERYSATVTGEISVAEQVDVFGEFIYSNRDETRANTPSIISQFAYVVPATNPFNPFGEDVAVDYLLSALGPEEERSKIETLRSVLGLKGTAGSWDWQFSLLRIDDEGENWTENRADPLQVQAALASADPSTALNVFSDGPGGSDELLRSLVAAPIVDDYRSDATQVGGYFTGPLLSLPAGSLDFVLGFEARKEQIEWDAPSIGTAFSVDRKSEAVYSEFRLPITRSLKATIAARYDDYDDFGGTFNPQYELTWRPVDSLALTASYGTSFRPPSLYELHQPEFTFSSFVIDAKRNDEFAPVTFQLSGNPDLEPEESNSTTFGFLYTPDWNGFKFGATYWDIRQDQRVQSVPFSLILPNEALFPDRFVRAEPSPADIAAGLPGPLVSIDLSTVNFGKLETQGIDLQLGVQVDSGIGRFAPELLATWVSKYEARDLPGIPPVERIGVANVQGTIPRWRATLILPLAWRVGGLSTAVRYTPSYDDVTIASEPNGRIIDQQALVDLQAWLDIGKLTPQLSFLRDTQIRIGVNNLFDSEPQFSESAGTLGYDMTQADLRQRFAYLSISKTF